jgi:ribosomal protein S18 acetylase RimI-like enzyme
MTTELHIRPVRTSDVTTVVQIQEAIIQRPVAPGWIKLIELQLAKHDGVSLVAEQRGEVIGFFFGEIKHGDFGLEHAGWIEMFGVNPKVMGQGVGRSLADAAMAKFRERGVRDIYTAVRWDSGDLLAFFKNIGFSLSNYINLKTRLE